MHCYMNDTSHLSFTLSEHCSQTLGLRFYVSLDWAKVLLIFITIETRSYPPIQYEKVLETPDNSKLLRVKSYSDYGDVKVLCQK